MIRAAVLVYTVTAAATLLGSGVGAAGRAVTFSQSAHTVSVVATGQDVRVSAEQISGPFVVEIVAVEDAAALGVTKFVADQVLASDALTSMVEIAPADAATTGDEVVATKVFLRGVTDAATATEAAALSTTSPETDTTTLTDTQAVGVSKNVADAVVLTGNQRAIVEKNVADAVALVDAHGCNVVKAADDTATVSDTVGVRPYPDGCLNGAVINSIAING